MPAPLLTDEEAMDQLDQEAEEARLFAKTLVELANETSGTDLPQFLAVLEQHARTLANLEEMTRVQRRRVHAQMRLGNLPKEDGGRGLGAARLTTDSMSWKNGQTAVILRKMRDDPLLQRAVQDALAARGREPGRDGQP